MVFSCILNSISMRFFVVSVFRCVITLFVVQRISAKTLFCKIHCTLIYFLWFTKVKYVKFASFLISIESASSLFYRLTHKLLI